MKTIELITRSIAAMKEIGLPACLQVGTFKVTSKGHLINWGGKSGEYDGSAISFDIVFKPSHIQKLLDMGVSIDLSAAVMDGLSPKALRFKSGREAIKQGDYAPYYYKGNPANAQTGVIENWLRAPARCSPDTLARLDKYCRDNHRNHIAIHNNTILANAGWRFKIKYSKHVAIESQFTDIKAIRRNAHGKRYEDLLPIHKRVLKM